MAHICQGRTVLIIAHRLSAVRHADRIIVMDKGRIVETGSHEVLVGQPQGLYAHLWRMQDGGHSSDAPIVQAEPFDKLRTGPVDPLRASPVEGVKA